ncbi:MAG TPA: aconitate hydratase [Caldilineae bacterium]|nr:aconitate hydratase [Caldilineae bacterium]
MGYTLVHKILEAHLVSGQLRPGHEIAIRIDQTLTQDASGTTAYLHFEALGIPRVRTELSVSYVDHNLLQTGFESADDHRFLQTFAARHGIYFSRPGNGICHQVHLERFARPGRTLLGSDSHTPTAGGMGMLAFGAGGLDVAVAMGGEPYHLVMPRIMGVHLTGRLPAWVSAKDVILELLRRLSIKGGVGYIIEYFGEGVRHLDVPARATIANMGTELGATSSLFPSDEATRQYLRAQGREDVWVPLEADGDAIYDEIIEIDLSQLEPLIACPSSPDNVVPVHEVAGRPVAQVCIGSCTNSSYADLMKAAAMLRGRTVHPQVSMTLSPGSRQVYTMIARDGALADLIAAGVRVLESGCGPCVGMGQAPPTGGISLRTFNRNFPGRSGTPGDQVYLCSPETAVAAAITGVITDPRDLGDPPRIHIPERFIVDDRMIIPPPLNPDEVEVIRGPNIKPIPLPEPMPDMLTGSVLLKVGEDISTDHISPAGAHVLPLRSNLPALAEYTFTRVDPEFPRRARELGGGFIVGGYNYGQGSAREHAALAPRYLGVTAVIACSFARIHHANLVNFGILPLTFTEDADYERIRQGDHLEIPDVRAALRRGDVITVYNRTQGTSFSARHQLTAREVEIVVAGGLLNYIRLRDRGLEIRD